VHVLLFGAKIADFEGNSSSRLQASQSELRWAYFRQVLRSSISNRSSISAADKIIAFFARNRPGQTAWSPKHLVSFDALEIRLLILTAARNSRSPKSIQIEGFFVILYLFCGIILSSRPHGGLHRATGRIMHIRNKPIRPEPVYGLVAILRIPEALVHMRDPRVHRRDFPFGKLPIA
jgi:hypothetical protein